MRFIVSATDPSGRHIVEDIEAESGDAAVNRLRDKGLTEVRLETNSIQGAIDGTVSDEHVQAKEALFSTADEVEGARQNDLVFHLKAMYRASWFLWIPSLLWLLWRRTDGGAVSWLDGFLLIGIFNPIPMALWSVHRTARYRKMIEAAAICRWQEVLDRLPRVEKLLRLSGDDLAELEISVRRAQALAGLGRSDEAEEEMSRLHDLQLVPEFMYWLRLASVYDVARDFDSAEECYRKALEQRPEDPTVHLTMAEFQILRRRDPAVAEAVLKAAQNFEIAEISMWAVHRIEGTIALERGDPERARASLRRAIAELSKLVGSPLMPFCVLQIRAYLALALAQLGETSSANRHFAKAKPLLLAQQETELIERLQMALGHELGH